MVEMINMMDRYGYQMTRENYLHECKATLQEIKSRISCEVQIPLMYLQFVQVSDCFENYVIHSCYYTGVTRLEVNCLRVPGYIIHYAFCRKCGKVIYYREGE